MDYGAEENSIFQSFFLSKFLCFHGHFFLANESWVLLEKMIYVTFSLIGRYWLIKSYEQILYMKILKFKSYFPLGKLLAIDGKSKVIDGKEVSAPQKRREGDGYVICFIYIDHAYMYLYIKSIFVNSSSFFFYSTFFSSFLFSMLYINRRKSLRLILY